MTLATVRAAAEHLVGQGQILPHQLAALSALDQRLSPEQRDEFSRLWRVGGASTAPAPLIWLEPARKIVKEFEGRRLQAYLCSAGKPTIGYGHTGLDVQLGRTITQQQAEALLELDLRRFATGIHDLIPSSRTLGGNQQAALISWAFNVGLGAVETSTLRRRINAGESAVVVVREELPRWNKVEGEVSPGLVRRRAAEVALFAGGAPAPRPNPLPVPYYAQLDSATDQARRMCFSSSCAMALAFLRPGILKGPNGDDQYLERVRSFGDTTSATAQVQALASYELKADFTRAADFALLERQIDAGLPVPCGYLHRGPVEKPSGGGHWLCVVGYDPTHVIVHDPLGEADLLAGATLNRPARFSRYSRKNWGRRWMVEGPGSGWAVVVGRG
jgi:GH24 family phage-related lysozyme (muramidase)